MDDPRDLPDLANLDYVDRVACFSPYHFHRIFRQFVGETFGSFIKPDDFTVAFRDYAERRVAYLRVTRPFEDGRVTDAAARLVPWARARGLADGEWLGYMWDDPEIVALDKCRYDVGVALPPGADVDDDVSVITFPAVVPLSAPP